MQQELSETFGIPTFDIEGNISTVPTTRSINTSIDVGTGRFTESAFKKSLDILTQEQSIFNALGSGFKQFITDPIIEIFDALFTDKVIEGLPLLQQQRIKEIDVEILSLEARLIPVPACKQIFTQTIFRGFSRMVLSRTDCTEKDAAEKQNSQFDVIISRLKTERNAIIQEFGVIAGAREEIEKITAQINSLIDAKPFTAQIKAELQNKLQEGSIAIEKILEKSINIEQSELSVLQIAMQAGAFALQQEISQEANLLDGILGDLSDGLFGIGAFFLEGFEIFAKSFEDLMNDLFDMTPEKLSEAQKLISTSITQDVKSSEK